MRTQARGSPRAPLHVRIDYLLTEARVILPGAQALLGFQFVVTLMKSFDSLPQSAQLVHFFGLALVLLAIVLLIAPAAIHRLAFGGDDDPRFLRIASRVVTVALLPLALGLGCESFVAVRKLFDSDSAALLAALISSGALLILWYVVPFAMRRAAHAG
jgi:hypothetical protein